MLAGCEDSAKSATPSRDAGQDQRVGDKDAAGPKDSSSVEDAGRGNEVETARKDGAAQEVGTRADAGLDLAEHGDAGRGATDSPTDSAAGQDGRSIDASLADEVGPRVDGPVGTDGRTGIDGTVAVGCQGILLDNTFTPPTYPVLYRAPDNAAERFAARSAELRSAHAIDHTSYTFEGMPVSWAATVERGTGSCTLMLGGALTKENVLATVRTFLSRWGDLFQYKDNATEARPASCDSKFCMVRLAQDYCGLPVYSAEQSYAGDLSVDAYSKDGCLWRAISHFVPMIPIPGNVLLSDEKLKQAILGLTLTYGCGTGPSTVEVSQTDSFTMPERPTVLVRKSATQADTLEYRLAVSVLVEVGGAGGMPWIVYVDGLDGTVLASVASFACH